MPKGSAQMTEKLSTLLSEDDPLLTSKDVIAYLRRLTLPPSPSWLEKLGQGDRGPPVECYWGRRPMWRRSRIGTWAVERMKAPPRRPPDHSPANWQNSNPAKLGT